MCMTKHNHAYNKIETCMLFRGTLAHNTLFTAITVVVSRLKSCLSILVHRDEEAVASIFYAPCKKILKRNITCQFFMHPHIQNI